MSRFELRVIPGRERAETAVIDDWIRVLNDKRAAIRDRRRD